MTRRVGDNKIALNCLKSSSMSNEWHGGDGGFHIDLGLGTHFIPQLSSVEIQLDSSEFRASKQASSTERERERARILSLLLSSSILCFDLA